ncbi:MAG TPA: hypothetical protein VK484_07935, partial [Ferruginibacter sp.]|nr:hypothetical protein [Ferruginibacter sp.]
MKNKRIQVVLCSMLIPLACLFMPAIVHAQTEESKQNAEKFKLMLGGTFAKPKIMPNMKRFALAQIRVNFKLTTTESTSGKEKSTGAMAGAKLAAYLETTDGKLTQEDFQEITDHFYHYFQVKLKEAGVDTVAWSAIAGTDFNKSGDDDNDKADKDDPVVMSTNANNGNVMYRGKTAFAFGKAKRATNFCEEVDAAAGFFNITLDFANILLDVKINTSEHANAYTIEKTRSFKYKGIVIPQMIIVPTNFGNSRGSLLWNQKSQAEALAVLDNIEGDGSYADKVSQDPSRLKNNLFAFSKSLTPVVIETTRSKYIAAAKKSLEKFA